MNIAIDSNIFIADPWLRSQHIRTLIDFLRKSQSHILLSEVVEVEVKAHFRRRFSECLDSIEYAIRQAQRNGIVGLPEFSRDQSLSDTFLCWETNFDKILDGFVLRIPAHNRILSEIIRRAAERIPPCSEDGKGVRDAIIWLSLLDFCSRRRRTSELIFISANTKDFASPDQTSLRDELKVDAEKYRLKVYYYPSLDVFLKKYAEPISYVNLEWIKARLDLHKAELIIRESLASEALIKKLDIEEPKYFERFVITAINRVISIRLDTLMDFDLWRFSDDHIEARLSFHSDVLAEVECVRDPQLRLFYFTEESESESNVNSITLLASSKLNFEISAEIKKDSIELRKVERVTRT